MKITIVCDVLGEENNGTSVTTMNLVRSLKRKGHTVNILCCDGDKMGKEGYFVCPQRHFGPFDGYVRHVGITLARPVRSIVRRAIEDADVVHCMLPFALTKTAISVARELGKPVTAGFHCQAENFSSYVLLKNCAPVNYLTYRLFYDKVFGRVDRVHYPSQFIRDVFERATAPTRGVVISNGVADELTSERREKPLALRDKFVILSTGRYSREKCQSVLIKAVAQSRHRADIRLVLAGKGVLDARFERLARKGGVDADMRFFDRESLRDVLGYADLYVHPADIELEGIAALEAVRAGLPVVVSDSARSATRGLARDERNLFRAGSAKDLAERIDYWIEHPAARKECAEHYASCVCVANASTCMDEMEKMFEDVIAEHARARAAGGVQAEPARSRS